MSPRIWSDEDRLFIPRMGGWSINFKHIARKLGWVKPSAVESSAPGGESHEPAPETHEDRLRRSVEHSRFEDN